MRIIFCFISFDGGSEDCCNHSHRKTDGQAKKHTNTGLPDMKTVVLIFFHILCAWYPDFFRMAKPDAVKHQSVIPINDQPDQVGIPKPFPECICSIKLFQDNSEDEHKSKQGNPLSEDIYPGKRCSFFSINPNSIHFSLMAGG